MPTELILFLIVIGAGTGSISSLIKCSPTLIAIPAFFFFLPVFNIPFDNVMLPIVSTCLIAFLPTHLYSWIQLMKRGKVDFSRLINFAPGIVMGAIIGAQLLSLINFIVFKVMFSLIAVFSILNILLTFQSVKKTEFNINKVIILPFNLLLAAVSLLAGNSGRVLIESVLIKSHIEPEQKEGTVSGLVVFASIAAMVGFIYPAQPFDYVIFTELDNAYYAGSIHLPSLIILAISHFFFYWICRNRENHTLDNTVLSISFIVFILCTLVRLWV